jgi:hypothetical protein
MARRRAHLTVIVGVGVLFALVGASCAKGSDFGEVNAASDQFGASLETSTTIDGLTAFAQSRGLSGNASKRAGATQNLLDEIAANPELLDDLENLTTEELQELTGLSESELDELGITPATVSSLGTVLKTIGGRDGGDDEGDGGEFDAGLANAVLVRGGQLTEEGLLLINTFDPATLATLIGTAATVGPEVTGPLGNLLAFLDPEGLGQLEGNDGALSALTVIMAAILGRDPGRLENLANAGDVNPRLRNVAGSLARLAASLEPEFVERINQLTDILGPNTLKLIGSAIGLIGRKPVAELVEVAFADPVVVGTMFGALVLMIPGLPELVAPESFGSDPRSIYTGMAALYLTALVNMDAPGIRDFLKRLGVDVDPILLD